MNHKRPAGGLYKTYLQAAPHRIGIDV